MYLTQKELKKQVHYDPITGIFTRILVKHGLHDIHKPIGTPLRWGHLAASISGKRYLLHRLAFLYVEGYMPENEVDHIDRNPGNNKWDNLREVSHLCNMRNCKCDKRNTSGITGIYWAKERNKWYAQIRILGKNLYLGYFVDKLDAAKARWEAEKKYGWPDCNTTSMAYQYIKKYREEDSV